MKKPWSQRSSKLYHLTEGGRVDGVAAMVINDDVWCRGDISETVPLISHCSGHGTQIVWTNRPKNVSANGTRDILFATRKVDTESDRQAKNIERLI